MSSRTTLARALVLALAGYGAAAGPLAAQEVEFDLQQLRQHGLSADVATFFAKEARFLPGTHLVGVSVNAARRQPVQLRFDSDGALCLDQAALAQLGLKPLQAEGEGCGDLLSSYPGSRIELKPGSAQIDITVAAQALIDDGQRSRHARGGSALVLNYDLFAQRMQGTSGSSGYLGARMEAGFNAANWAVRSRGEYAKRGEQSGYIQQETFAQRPVERLSALLQLGQISAASDGFGGIPVWGAQLLSDDAQLQTARLSVPITGTAQSHAVLEVRQRGTIIHRSVVTPGPFVVDAVGATSGSADLDVTVVEEDGQTTRFRVPAPMAAADAPQPATFQLGVGRYRAPAGAALDASAPWLAYAGHAFDARPGMRLSSSALLSAGYQAAQAQASFSLGERSWWGVGARASNAASGGFGHELQVQGNAAFNHGLNAGVSWQTRSAGYRTLEGTLGQAAAAEEAALHSLSASASWSNERWGSFSYNVWASPNQEKTALGHSLSASRRFGRATANVTVQHSGVRGTSAYLNLQVPLGSGSVRARAYRNESGAQTLGAAYQNRTDGGTAYQLDASRTDSSQRLGASASRHTGYGNLSAGIAQTSNGSRMLHAGASGGLALAGDGTFAFSSSKITDTFAIVKIPGVSGVRMQGAGAGMTTALGTALVPTVAPYRLARLQLDGRSLPLNYRFSTTALDLALARGSVGVYTISAQEIRQLMLTVTTPAGGPAVVGSALYDAAGEFIGTVIGDGNAILDNEQIGQPLFMEYEGGRCEVRYSTPAQFSAERPYEEASGQCA